MAVATPPATHVDSPRKAAVHKPLSLTAASKAVGVSTSTLRRAIRDKKLKAEKTDEGHYKISVAELMQYEANELDTRAAGVSTHGETAPAAPPVAGRVDIPVAAVSHRVEGESVQEARIDGLEQQISLHKDTIRRLEGDVESWQEQAKSWQKHADNNLRLLEDKREQESVSTEATSTHGSRFPLAIAAGFLIASGAAVLAFYPDTLRDFFEVKNEPVIDAAMLEIDAQTDVSSIETEGGSAAVPEAIITQKPVVFPSLLLPEER